MRGEPNLTSADCLWQTFVMLSLLAEAPASSVSQQLEIKMASTDSARVADNDFQTSPGGEIATCVSLHLCGLVVRISLRLRSEAWRPDPALGRSEPRLQRYHLGRNASLLHQL